jgi:hypothetical protein
LSNAHSLILSYQMRNNDVSMYKLPIGINFDFTSLIHRYNSVRELSPILMMISSCCIPLPATTPYNENAHDKDNDRTANRESDAQT